MTRGLLVDAPAGMAYRGETKGDEMKRILLFAIWVCFFGCGDDDSPTGSVSSQAGDTFPANPQAGDIFPADLPGGTSMEFVWIESGTFMIGSPESEEGRYGGEGPQHEVTISQGFWLGKTELTQRQWRVAMGTKPWSGEDLVRSNANHPAVYISWDDMQEFIDKLNAAAGEAVYRLPTSAEWEYACRAGTTTPWSFGDDESKLTDHAWYNDNAWDIEERYAHAVGTKLPNPWGLYDMHGNVWEWGQDGFDDYSSSAQVDPMGLTTGSVCVLRGGAFHGLARDTRSANRGSYSPDARHFSIGARLLRTK